jgi:hypothetical protein
MLYFNANLFEEMSTETNRYIGLYNMNLQSPKLPTLSALEFHKKVAEGLAVNVPNKMTGNEKKTKLKRRRRHKMGR